jgi:hypothetical protein
LSLPVWTGIVEPIMKTMKRYTPLVVVGLMLAAVQPALVHAQSVPLADSWSEYDLEQDKGQSVSGLLTLTGQSSTGFTGTVRTNSINSTVANFPPKSQYLPRIFQTFANQPITNNGSRVTVSFDVVMNSPVQNYNVAFRVSLGDTNANNAVLAGFDLGAADGQNVLFRYDRSITANTNYLDPSSVLGLVTFNNSTLWFLFSPTNLDYSWGSFCDGSDNYGITASSASGSAPNGVNLAPGSKHSFSFSVERTPGGLLLRSIWGNTNGAGVVASLGYPTPGGAGDDNNGQINQNGKVVPMNNINCVGFCLFGTGSSSAPFFDSGSYTISNLRVCSGFPITAIQRDPASGDIGLTWESNPRDFINGALYDVQYTTSLTSPGWTSLADTNIAVLDPSMDLLGGFSTSYTDSAPVGPARFYRVQKTYP